MMGSNPRTHPAAPMRAQSRQLNRVNLFVLIRVLFHYLEKVDARLLVQAKQVLKDCDKRKKDGDPEFQSLAGSIESRIRATVGDLHWKKALTIQRQVLLNKQKQKVAAMQKKYKESTTPAAKAAAFRASLDAKMTEDGSSSTMDKTPPLLVKPGKPSPTPGVVRAQKPVRPPQTISIDKPIPFVPVLDKSSFYSTAAAQACIAPNLSSMTAMRTTNTASSVASSESGSCD